MKENEKKLMREETARKIRELYGKNLHMDKPDVKIVTVNMASGNQIINSKEKKQGNDFADLLKKEPGAFEKIGSMGLNHPYSFNNLIEEILFRERNNLNELKTEEKKYSTALAWYGKQLYEYGNVMLALSYYSRAIIWNPSDSEIRFKLIHILMELNDLEEVSFHLTELGRYAYRPEDLAGMQYYYKMLTSITGHSSGDYNRLISLVEENAVILMEKARQYENMEDEGTALMIYIKIHSLLMSI